MAEKLEQDEKARLAVQREKLGPDGLAKAEQELEAAKAEHEKPIPTDVLTSFPVPDVKSISWIPVQSVQEPGKGRSTAVQGSGQSQLSKHIQSDGAPLSMFVQYDHVKVNIL
jgi:Zn-dependent M16 (insulinase) family peptidase